MLFYLRFTEHFMNLIINADAGIVLIGMFRQVLQDFIQQYILVIDIHDVSVIQDGAAVFEFIEEVKDISPDSKVIIPTHLETITIEDK